MTEYDVTNISGTQPRKNMKTMGNLNYHQVLTKPGLIFGVTSLRDSCYNPNARFLFNAD